LKRIITSRLKSRYFIKWAFLRHNKNEEKPKKDIDFLIKAPIRSSFNFQEPLKNSITRFHSSSDLNQLFSQTSKPIATSMKNSESYSFLEKDEKSALFDRLYQDAAKKKLLLEKFQNEKKNKGMEECTFRPEIIEYAPRKGSVYERLNHSDVREKEEYYKIQKESKELEGCTFRPKTNSTKGLSRDGSFDKLYKDAEIQRQKQREKELLEKHKEVADCTFRPTVLNPTTTPTGSVYEKLYNSYQQSQIEKRRLELERKSKDENDFIPKLLTPKKEGDSVPVYARLYAEVEKRKEKLKKNAEEKQANSNGSRPKKPEDPPRYEHLYSLHKETQEKKIMLQEKYFKESGVSFKPNTSKNNTPSKSRSHTPKSAYPLPRKPSIDSGSENNI
jgi:hypothetical protein